MRWNRNLRLEALIDTVTQRVQQGRGPYGGGNKELLPQSLITQSESYFGDSSVTRRRIAGLREARNVEGCKHEKLGSGPSIKRLGIIISDWLTS